MDNLIIGIGFCLIGPFMTKVYTKDPNSIVGYRSSMANKNKDTWIEAQKISGRLMLIAGLINLIAYAILYFLKDVNNGVPTFAVILITVFLMIGLTEVKLRKLFNADGTRK